MDDARVEILTQELAQESHELIDKQRLMSLPVGQEPLVDALRERIKQEIHQHEQNLMGLQREIDRVVRQQQRARAKL